MAPLSKNIIEIMVLDDTGRHDCSACVEIDWSLPDSIALAYQRIKDRFNASLKLEYIDLSKGTANQQALKWSQAIRERNLSVPLLLINGELRISGQFSIRQLLDAIETVIEMGVRG
jgi:disulfide oxidoreductase YuzD